MFVIVLVMLLSTKEKRRDKKMARNIRMLSIYLMALAFVITSVSVSPALGAGKFRVAAVMPGTITDGSFNQSCYEGLKIIEKELGAQIAFSEGCHKQIKWRI